MRRYICEGTSSETNSGDKLERLAWGSSPVLLRHQFSYPRIKDLLVAFVGLRNRLIVFIRTESGNCCFTILELSDQQDIAYG